MASSLCRWLVLATTIVALGVVGATAQSQPLPPVVQGDVAPGSPQIYAVSLNAGDLITGTFELVRGGDIAFEVFDPAGAWIKSTIFSPDFDLGQPRPVGFAASVNGIYRVQVSRREATPASPALGSFVLRTNAAAPPSVRMSGVHAHPTIRYMSPRMEQLRRELDEGRTDALARFWTEAKAGGGPLVEPFGGGVVGPRGAGNVPIGRPADSVLVTFLWQETFETYNVRVSWPQPRPDDFFMTRVPRTDVWYKTILVRRGSRFQYSLLPNVRPGDEPFIAQRDPLNPRVAWEDEEDSSLLELEGAPDESWFRTTPKARGVLGPPQPFPARRADGPRDTANASATFRIYTPPGYSLSGGPYPLLVMFPTITFSDEFATMLDNLVSAGRIRPLIACFFSGIRVADVGPSTNSQPFAEALAREFLPAMRRSHRISVEARDVIIGGFSAGGSIAARIAFRYPDAFGTVLLHSAALRSNGLSSNDTILEYRDGERRALRFYQDVGLYENGRDLPVHELAQSEGSSTIANRHFRDVLMAKGYEVDYRETGGMHDAVRLRSAFPVALQALLEP